MRGGGLITLAIAAALLASYATKPLKAPCSRDEGPALVPMAYSSLGGSSPSIGKVATDHACGPLRPVNGPQKGPPPR